MIVKASDFTANPSFHLSPDYYQYALSGKKRLIFAEETGNDNLVIAVPNCKVLFKSDGLDGLCLYALRNENAELVKLIEGSIIANLSEKLGVSKDKVYPLCGSYNSPWEPTRLYLELKRKGFKITDAGGGEPEVDELTKFYEPQKALLFLHIESVGFSPFTNVNYGLQYQVSQIHLPKPDGLFTRGPVSVAEICDHPAQFL
jgi:hypothetical protein